MTIWMAKYEVRQKKKKLEMRVKQVEKLRSYRYFTHWLALFKKQQYLDDQLDSIIAIKAESAIQQAFDALLRYARERIAKKQLGAYARQHYIHRLGVRIYRTFKLNAALRRDKQRLYDRVLEE